MNLKDLAKSRGTNLKQVAERCSIPASTLYAISRGDTNFDNVGIGTAMKVANALGMTVEELYTGNAASDRQKEDAQANGDAHCEPISQEELELISLYRNADAQGRAHVMETARICSALSKKNADRDGDAMARH